MQSFYQDLYSRITFCPSTPECFIHCALARDGWRGHFVQDAPGSFGAGPQLLLPLSPPLSRTHPALPLSQLLPHLPSSAGPVPRPGQGWWSPTETDQRKVRLDRRLGGFAVVTPSHSYPPWKVGLVARQLTQQNIIYSFLEEKKIKGKTWSKSCEKWLLIRTRLCRILFSPWSPNVRCV